MIEAIKKLTIEEAKAMIEALQEYVEAEERKRTGYERAELNGIFYMVVSQGGFHAIHGVHYDAPVYEEEYNSANYFSDEQLAEDRARFFDLYNQLVRFKAENDRKIPENDWYDVTVSKWFISYDYEFDEIKVYAVDCIKRFGEVYFSTKECAEKAAEKFKNELLWYFRGYKDRV